MTPRRRPGPRAGELAGRWFVLLAALAGLFAMHGLSDGTGPTTLVTASATAGSASDATLANDANSAIDTLHADAPRASGTPAADTMAADGAAGECDGPCRDSHSDSHNDGHSDGHAGSTSSGHDMGLMGLCLAVLVAALLGSVAAYRRWWTTSRRTLAALMGRDAVTAATSRGLDPPDLHRLCIARC